MADRISLLLPDLRGGGAERVNINLANEFVARGFKVDIVLMRAIGDLMPLLDSRIRVIDLGAKRMRNVFSALVHYLRQERPSSLLANMWPLTSIAIAARLMSGVRMRMVVAEHTTLSKSEVIRSRAHYWLLRKSMRLFACFADGLVTVSEGVADDLAKVTGIRRDRFSTIYNPIVRTGGPVGVISEAVPHPATSVIINVGALKEQKDQATLLRAFQILTLREDVHLLILGEGALRPALEDLAVELGIADKVSMPGFKFDPAEAYRNASLFVLSSAWEGFGNVIVEALEQGTPVVSTDCPSGPNEILDNGRYGTLVPVGDPAALAQAMQDALGRPHDKAALKARAADFSVAKAAEAYLDLLLPDWRQEPSRLDANQ